MSKEQDSKRVTPERILDILKKCPAAGWQYCIENVDTQWMADHISSRLVETGTIGHADEKPISESVRELRLPPIGNLETIGLVIIGLLVVLLIVSLDVTCKIARIESSMTQSGK